MSEMYEPSADFVRHTMDAVDAWEQSRPAHVRRLANALESQVFAITGGTVAGLLGMAALARAWFAVLAPAVCH